MLEHQLESATLEFLDNDEKGMRFEPSKNTLHLSSIFKWYAGDFTGGSTAVAFFARGKVLEWVTQHLPEDLAAEVQKEDPGISYLDYDLEPERSPESRLLSLPFASTSNTRSSLLVFPAGSTSQCYHVPPDHGAEYRHDQRTLQHRPDFHKPVWRHDGFGLSDRLLSATLGTQTAGNWRR